MKTYLEHVFKMLGDRSMGIRKWCREAGRVPFQTDHGNIALNGRVILPINRPFQSLIWLLVSRPYTLEEEASACDCPAAAAPCLQIGRWSHSCRHDLLSVLSKPSAKDTKLVDLATQAGTTLSFSIFGLASLANVWMWASLCVRLKGAELI